MIPKDIPHLVSQLHSTMPEGQRKEIEKAWREMQRIELRLFVVVDDISNVTPRDETLQIYFKEFCGRAGSSISFMTMLLEGLVTGEFPEYRDLHERISKTFASVLEADREININ